MDQPVSASPLARRVRRALAAPNGLIAVVLLAILAGLAVAAPLIFPGGYDAQGPSTFAGPTLRQPFGTDEFGRDLFVRTIYAIRADLSLVAVAVPVAALVGTAAGLVGMVSGALGAATQRVMDVIVGFPGLILGISVIVVVGQGWTALVVALTLNAMPPFARLARATLLAQQDRDYVHAARMFGHTKAAVVRRHVLPHAIDAAVTQAAITVVTCIFLESSLSIVNLGLQPPHPSLGSLLSSGARFMQLQPFYVLGPGLALLILVLGFNLLANVLKTSEPK